MGQTCSMATLTSDLKLVWTTETNRALGFATKTDLMLGDMTVSQNIDLVGILDEAWMEIEAILGQKYSTPIDRSDNLPHYTVQFLTRVHAYLATAIVVLGQGGASQEAREYSDYLRERAGSLLDGVVVNNQVLDGLSNYSVNASSTSARGPAILVGDSVSPFAFFEDTVYASTVGNPGTRTVWRPDESYSDPNA